MPDKKVNVSIETQSDTRGIEEVRKRLEALEREATRTGKSFDELATSEFGDVSGVFDAFFKELESARTQLNHLGDQGVEVQVAASGLDQLEAQLKALKAEIGVQVQDKEIADTRREIAQLSTEAKVRVDVSDGELEEARRKADQLDQEAAIRVTVQDRDLEQAQRKREALESATATIKVAVSDQDLDEAQRKSDQLDGTADLHVAVQDAALAEAQRKADQLDGDQVIVKVDADIAELNDASRALGQLKDTDLDVTVDSASALRTLATLRDRLHALSRQATEALAVDVDDSEVQALAKRLQALQQQLQRVDKSSQSFDALQAGIRQTVTQLGQLSRTRGFEGPKKGAADAITQTERLQAELRQLEQQLGKFNTGSGKFGQLSGQLNQLRGSVSGAERSFHAAGKGVGGLGGALGNLTSIATGTLGKVAGLTTILAAFSQGVRNASATQDLQAQLQILLGSADAAQERITELRDFAARTPFQLPGIVEASRILETITQGALSTGDGLQLVGDLAAGTGENFSNLAVHVGRLYDGLQNGAPVGESMLRLQELGIITAETRREIEELQKANKRGGKVWDLAARDFGRFSGALEERSKTLSGVWSTLKDNFNQLLGTLGKPLLVPLTRALQETIPVVQGAMVATQGLFRWLGLLGPEAARAGDRAADAYQKIATEAGKAGQQASVAAERQAKDTRRAADELDRLLTRLGQVADANQVLREAITDRKVAEIEARTDLSDEEKRTRIFEIQSEARLDRYNAEQEKMVRGRELALEQIASLESQQDRGQERLQEAFDRAGELQEAVRIRQTLAEAKDAAAQNIAAIKTEIALARDALDAEQVRLLEEALASAQSVENKAKEKLERLENALSADKLSQQSKQAEQTIATLTNGLKGLATQLSQANNELFPLENQIREALRRNARLFREQERTAQAQFQGQTNKQRESDQGQQAQETSKKLDDAEKALSASDKALTAKAEQVLALAKQPGARKSFFDPLERLVSELADGASAEELNRLTRTAESLRKSNNAEGQALGQAIKELLQSREDTERRIDDLRQLEATEQTPDQTERLQRRINRSTERAAEAAEEVEAQVSNPRLAAEIRAAREALSDGATIAEAQALSAALREVNTATSAGLRQAVQEARTQANVTQALLGDFIREQQRQARELQVLQGQLKNTR